MGFQKNTYNMGLFMLNFYREKLIYDAKNSRLGMFFGHLLLEVNNYLHKNISINMGK
jgi:hypothetical protein